MTEEQHLLTKVTEECAEVAQRACKAIIFTLQEVQEGQDQTNEQRLIQEFNDLCGVMQMLHEKGMIKYPFNQDLMDAKKIKVEKWMKYSKSLGRTD